MRHNAYCMIEKIIGNNTIKKELEFLFKLKNVNQCKMQCGLFHTSIIKKAEYNFKIIFLELLAQLLNGLNVY